MYLEEMQSYKMEYKKSCADPEFFFPERGGGVGF